MGRTNTTTADTSGLKNIASTEGFVAGDLIYQSTTGHGLIPDNNASTGTFEAIVSDPTEKFSVNTSYNKKTIASPQSSQQNMQPNGSPVAVLSNGNIVTVYQRTANGETYQNSYGGSKITYFRIDQENGTSVVAETQINNNSTSGYAYDIGQWLNVVANPTGGFAVSWTGNSNYKLRVRCFDNAGTAVGSLREEVSGNYCIMHKGACTPDGMYAFAHTRASDTTIYVDFINSSGVYQGQQSASNILNGRQNQFDICATNDNRIAVAYKYSSPQIPRLKVWNTSQGVINDFFMLPTSNASFEGLAIDKNSSNNGITCQVKSTSSGNPDISEQESFYNLSWDGVTNSDSGVTVSDPYRSINFPSDSVYANRYWGIFKNIGSDQFIFNFPNYRTGADTALVSQAGVLLSPLYVSLGHVTGTGVRSVIKTNSGQVRFYSNDNQAGTNGQFDVGTILNQPFAGYIPFNTTKNIFEGENLSLPYAKASGQVAVSGYSKEGSTPTKAAYLAASSTSTTETLAGTVSQATLVTDFTVVAGDSNAQKILGYELSNGNIFVAFISSNGVNVQIYDATYTQLSSLVVPTSTNNYQAKTFDGALLDNGTIILVHYAPNNELSYSTYDSTGSQITNTTALGLVVRSNIPNGCTAVAALRNQFNNALFAVSYQNSSGYPEVAIFASDYSTILHTTGNLTTSSTSWDNGQLICNSIGVIYWNFHNTSSQWRLGYIYDYLNNGAYGQANELASYTSANYRRDNFKPFMMKNGAVVMCASNSSGESRYIQIYGQSNNSNSLIVKNDNSNMTNVFGPLYGVTGTGSMIRFNPATSYADPRTLWSYYALNTEVDTLRVTFGVEYDANNTSNLGTIISSKGDTAHIIARSSNASNFTFFKVRNMSEQAKIDVVQGTSISAAQTLDPNVNSFVGVSVTDCEANKSGVVQTNGNAVLNSSYLSTTPSQSFDARRPTTNGVSGSIVGRNVTLGD